MDGLIAQPQFGQRLRALRRARNLSQRDLAGGSISASYVSLLEAGHRVPAVKVVADLAAALGVGSSELIDGALTDKEAGAADVSQPSMTARDIEEELMERILTETAATAGDTSLAKSWAEAAYRRALDDGSPTRIVESGLTLNRALAAAGLRERRAEVLSQLVHAAESADLTQVLASILIDQASVARELGELRRARAIIERAGSSLPSTQFAGTAEEVRLAGVRAAVLCDIGEAETARLLIPDLLDVAARLGEAPVIGRAEWIAALVCSRLGDAAALDHLERARAALDSSMPVADWMRFCRAAASIVLDSDGDVAQAEELLNSARAMQRSMRMDRERPMLDVLEARIALARDDPERAFELCEGLLATGSGLAGFDVLRLRRILATAAVRLDDLKTARRELRRIDTN